MRAKESLVIEPDNFFIICSKDKCCSMNNKNKIKNNFCKFLITQEKEFFVDDKRQLNVIIHDKKGLDLEKMTYKDLLSKEDKAEMFFFESVIDQEENNKFENLFFNTLVELTGEAESNVTVRYNDRNFNFIYCKNLDCCSHKLNLHSSLEIVKDFNNCFDKLKRGDNSFSQNVCFIIPKNHPSFEKIKDYCTKVYPEITSHVNHEKPQNLDDSLMKPTDQAEKKDGIFTDTSKYLNEHSTTTKLVSREKNELELLSVTHTSTLESTLVLQTIDYNLGQNHNSSETSVNATTSAANRLNFNLFDSYFLFMIPIGLLIMFQLREYSPKSLIILLSLFTITLLVGEFVNTCII